MARKRSTTRKPITIRPRRIPKSKRLLESARRMVQALRQDLCGAGKTKTKAKTGRRNFWPRCVACFHRAPPEAFRCADHPGVCCCGWTHKEKNDQADDRDRDQDDEGDGR